MASTLLCLPEAIYFSLFLILIKDIKSKRILFTIFMCIEYAILMNVFLYQVYFQIAYTFITFLILKLLYKEKAIITDIFLFMIASILLIAISFVSYMIVFLTFKNFIVSYILNRLLLFGSLFLLKNKVKKLYNKINSLWNRRQNQKIRSLTVRNITIIIFNLMFCIINFGLLYFLMYLK